MKKIFTATLLFIAFNINAEIIYLEPVENAKFVNIENNIIIGFDETIKNFKIKVTGSKSGIHTGESILTADKKKLIFKPHTPFLFNEKVGVSINNFFYTFQTQITKPESNINSFEMLRGYLDNYSIANTGDAATLPQITVNISNNPAPGKLFMSNFPFNPQVPNTPYLLIVNNDGTIHYSKEMDDTTAIDFKRQPNGLLTYYHMGKKFYALDYNYNIVDSFACGNGMFTDGHELILLSNGHALLMSYDPQYVDMSLRVPGGNSNALVLGTTIQEIDQNKNVVFQWRSWDHFNILDAQHIDFTEALIDAVHGNAIAVDYDGHLLLSSRHISEITKINRQTGAIIWRLGGNNNQFTFPNDSIRFSYQHDIRRLPNGNVTLFDNGNFRPPQTLFSRALEYQLNEVTKVATLMWQYRHTPDIFAPAMGSAQRLPNGNTLIGWGSANPTFTEVRPNGQTALEMTLPQGVFTYRVFKDEVPALTFNLTALLEGSSNLNGMIPDTITVYLKDDDTPSIIYDSTKGVLDSNGTGRFLFTRANNNTDYYLVIKHRNSIETWSGECLFTNNVLNYNFTTSASQAFGNNLKLKNGKYTIYSGDINQDGIVDAGDLNLVDVALLNSLSGYVKPDLNGDNFVDASDLSIVNNNVLRGVMVIHP